MILRGFFFLVLVFSNGILAHAAQLKNITIAQQNNKTTLYFSLTGYFTHKLFLLQNPDRVVLDLNDTHLAYNLSQAHLNNGLIKQVRSSESGARTLRLVFDINQKVQLRSAPWQPQSVLHGIKVEFISAKPIAAMPIDKGHKVLVQQANKPAPRAYQPVISHNRPIKVPHSPSNKYLRDVIVVLDAGHGGKDPGAKGPRRSNEKHVVLAITHKLKQLIDRQVGMHAVLTRSGDYYVGLRQRLDIARKYNGDVFVSIHADAFNNPHSNGASVFALSQSGATSEAARWIAEKENYSELGGVNLGDLDDRNGMVRSVLIDLSQTATINSSLQMGSGVLRQLGGFATLHNHKVEQARFMVLKSPDIPSILVETGFISNPREERNLTSAAYQSRLSQAIFQGIKNYFWNNPPHGSRIEAMTANNVHIVKRGETLPNIARRYHSSVATLQVLNRFPSKNLALKPGQKLVIPTAWG